jgi:hypothetical protein
LDQEEITKIGRVVSALSVARKYIQFYPAPNSNVAGLIQHLSEGLWLLFYGNTRKDPANRSGDSGEGTLGELEAIERPVAPDGLLLIVERDQFRYGEAELGFDNTPTRKLAGDLYALGVKSHHVLPEVTREDLSVFLELTCLSPDEIEDQGGIVDSGRCYENRYWQERQPLFAANRQGFRSTHRDVPSRIRGRDGHGRIGGRVQTQSRRHLPAASKAVRGGK